jgi:hypothetical protein
VFSCAAGCPACSGEPCLSPGDSQITERGSHEELMAVGGQYAELFKLQARRFAGEEMA